MLIITRRFLSRGVAHAVRNVLTREPGRASRRPPELPGKADAGWASLRRAAIPADSTSRSVAERVNRFRTAQRSAGGPKSWTEELVPGLEMSGGHTLFNPGGRLPAHLHDFDESICII
jgi:hypothetical protein